ncbi:MAG: helix-turn-helix domain-containing protein [Flavisolibacter sp.]
MNKETLYQVVNPAVIDALRELIREDMRSIVRDELSQLRPPAEDETLLDAKETAKLCGGVSIITIHNWSNAGKLKKHKMGGRVFWKRGEVLKAMN